MKNARHLLFAIGCLLLLANSAFSSNNQSSIINSQLPIGSVRTASNRNISTSEILSRVRSRAGELFNPATATEDTKRIAELAGVQYCYYSTTIADNKIRLTFVVVERNIIRAIVFVGNNKVKAGTLRKKLGLKTGDYLDVILANSATETLTELYHKKGYAFVQVALDSEKLSLGKLIYKIDEGPKVKIASVKFSGNNAYKTGKLKKAIRTKEKKWFLWPGYYIEKGVDKDIAKMNAIYYERGFLDADVTAKRQFNKDKSKVCLTFVIDEGAAYTVEKIAVTGNKHFDEKQLRAELKLEHGRVYNERKANSDVERLVKLYRENGFINVRAERNVKFISKDRVSVEFAIIEGERFRIGRVNIIGNEQTQDKVVRRVLDEYDFQPGRWYDADIARGDGSGELEKRIRAMTLTEAATITPSGETPGQKDAQVSIVEGQTGMVMLGAGMASDSGVMGQLIFEQRNFDIKNWPESFSEFITGRAFKGAGQSLRVALQPGTEVSEYSVSFSEPYFRDKPVTLDVVGLSRQWERECYDEERTKGYVGFEKRYKNHWRRSIGIRCENIDVDGVESDAPKEIKDIEGSNAFAAVRLGLSRDLTNDRFNPSDGYSFDVSYEQAGGDHTFGVLSGTYRRCKTLYEDLADRKTVLAAKLHAATTIGDAPPFEKFYAGGSRSIRGFDYRGVSTRGKNTVTNKLDEPIGSDWIFLASAEVTVPLVSDNFAALFFVDSGAIDSGNYRAAVGAGIQILIPQWFGPVPMRFEIAAPIMKDDKDETQVFSFSVGRLF